LAAMGFRPVPLYNAVPSPRGVVALRPIQAALVAGAPRLATLVPAAPPVFLVDADRMGGDREIVPGLFDNRSVCRASDFPSPDFLWEAGIRRAVLIQRGARAADDLAPILFDWQRRGIDLWLERTDEEGEAGRYQMPRPSWLRQLSHRVRRWAMPLRPDGAYGQLVKHSSGG
jgi:hypothetical protein